MGTKAVWIRPNITFECNRHCPHCYVRTVRKDIRGTTMDINTVDQLIKKYREHVEKYGSSKYSSLRFLGGEPLLELEKVKYMINRFKIITPDIEFGIFTNSLLVDTKLAEWCRDNKVWIHVSLNDLSFETYNEKLKLLYDVGCPSHPYVVLTERNLNHLKEIFAITWKFTDRCQTKHEYGKIDDKSLTLYDEKVYEAVKYCLDTDKIFNPQFFYEQMPVYWIKEFRHMCGTRYFVIDPNGSVAWCFCRNDSIGNIWDEDFDFIENMKKFNPPEFHYKMVPECQDCEVKLICGGGCPIQRHYKWGRYDKPTPFCETNKKTLPLMIEMRDRWLVDNPHPYPELIGTLCAGEPTKPNRSMVKKWWNSIGLEMQQKVSKSAGLFMWFHFKKFEYLTKDYQEALEGYYAREVWVDPYELPQEAKEMA